ncbi:TetR/AcrR family transcriptional regulator [Ruegeria sp. Alg231-54]|uniref:TetR/AcrR family transcriptional regulator n=1 Tax=Ruegeria sp. Alg231-54 TaxID=1922221 RepID=UPI000D552DD1|nr:TetR/AcrR family transcriptional regulator [Ruegeria sp. Alg231-54]
MEIFVAVSRDRLADVSKRAHAKVGKFANRQAELADAALTTLAELGYARTSLRDIAENTEFSHGVLRYYFSDKNDLIVQCIRQYKSVCVRRYDMATEQAETPEGLVDAFIEKLTETLLKETKLHRLWYDLRSQALFDDVLQNDVRQIDRDLEDMTWWIVERYALLKNGSPILSSRAIYAAIDGLFQEALARVVSGDANGAAELENELRKLLPVIVKARK